MAGIGLPPRFTSDRSPQPPFLIILYHDLSRSRRAERTNFMAIFGRRYVIDGYSKADLRLRTFLP